MSQSAVMGKKRHRTVPRLHGEAYCPKQIEKKAICLDGDVFETLNEIRGGKT